jgi:hypothetical protein
MIITKKALSRRTVVRGLGAALALPLLDSMLPAATAFAKSPAVPPCRFNAVYVPNGIIMEEWTPAAEGADFAFTSILKPLEPFRKQLLVLSGLANLGAIQKTGNSSGHAQPSGAWLTGYEPVQTRGSARLEVGISMDQIAAQALGQQTRLPSLELGIEGSDIVTGVGACDAGYSCTYQNTISWRSASTPLPMEPNPRAVFEALFGDAGTTDAAATSTRLQRQRSILDAVADKLNRLQRDLGPRDRDRLAEYLDAVREIERRIQNAEQQRARELPAVDEPAGVPDSYDEHVKLMFDLQVLAFQTDMTRIITFQVGREQSGMTYPQIGVSDSHHPITHHAGDAKKIANVAKINTYHASLFAYYLEKLRATREGDGTLLDNMLLLYGSGIGDGNKHSYVDVPVVLAGGAAGHVKPGRHVKYASPTPLANLQLTMLHMLGVPIDKFGSGKPANATLSDLA